MPNQTSTSNPLKNYFFANKKRLIDKWPHYFDAYHQHFARFRNKKVTVVEFGVYHGGSLQMWKKYFSTKARIVGADIDPKCKSLEEPQIEIFIGDQEETTFLESLSASIGPVDILIDDGGHTMTQQMRTFESLFPTIKPGGLYVVEDLHTSYWAEYGGGYHIKGSFVEFTKSLIDDLHAWHSRNPTELQPNYYTANIRGIHIYDSLVIFEKGLVSRPRSLQIGKPSFRDSLLVEAPVRETKSNPQAKLFTSRAGIFDETRSSAASYSPSRWHHLRIDAPFGAGDDTASLRFDPVDRFGLVDVAAVTLRSAATGEVLWKVTPRSGILDLVVGGTCLKLRNQRFLRLFSYGDDPQIYLPGADRAIIDEPLVLDAWVRFDDATDALQKVLDAWNESALEVSPDRAPPALAATAEPPALEAPVAAVPDRGAMLMIYAAGPGGHALEYSLDVPYQLNRWAHLHIALEHGVGRDRLRIDPLTTPGLTDIAGVAVKCAVSGDVLWRANGEAGLESLEARGSAVRIPHPRLARIFSYGEDPQVMLPLLTGPEFEGPLRLEIWLRSETGGNAMQTGVLELANANARAVTASTQTQALLESTTRDSSEKEAELAALQEALAAMSLERDNAAARALDLERRENASGEDASVLRAELEQARAELVTLRHGERIQVTELGELRAESARLQIELEQRSVEATRLEQEERRLEEELGLRASMIVKLESALSAAQFDATGRRAELEAASKQRESLDSEVASLGTQLAQERQAAAGVIEELFLRTEELRRTAEQLAQRDKASAPIAAELVAARGEVALLRNEAQFFLAELNRQRATTDLSAELAVADAELIRLREAHAFTIEHLATRDTQLGAAKAELETAAYELSRLGKETAVLKRRLVEGESLPPEKRKKGSARAEEGNRRSRDGVSSASNVDLTVGESGRGFRSWLEGPTDPSVESDVVTIWGWVLPPPGSAIHAVRARAGQQSHGGEYGSQRPDVAEAFAQIENAAASGFHIPARLEPGLHEITLEASLRENEWAAFHVFTHEVQFAAAESAPSARVENPLALGELYLPVYPFVNHTGLLPVGGLVQLESEEIPSIIVRAEGIEPNALSVNRRKSDSAADGGSVEWVFQGYLEMPNFSGLVPLEIVAAARDEAETLCFRRTVEVHSPVDQQIAVRLPRPPNATEDEYQKWLETNRLTPPLLRSMATEAASLAGSGPLFTLVVSADSSSAADLPQFIDSLQAQIYPGWQLCIAAIPAVAVRVEWLLKDVRSADSRVLPVIESPDWSSAITDAVTPGTGEYVAFIEAGDRISADALLQIAQTVSAEPDLDLVYTDEDVNCRVPDKFAHPIFKSSFSPEMSLTSDSFRGLTVIRRTLLDRAGGFLHKYAGAAQLDLHLRIVEQTNPSRIRHLPFVCFHRGRRDASSDETIDRADLVAETVACINESLQRREIRAAAVPANAAGLIVELLWPKEHLTHNPVTIVVPTKDRADLLEKCVASLVRTIDPESARLIIVDDRSEEPRTCALLRDLKITAPFRCEVLHLPRRSDSFNFARLANEGISRARTELVLLLNNDTEALEAGWLEQMVGWMSIDGVGAVGPKLVYADGTVQHAGLAISRETRLPVHLFPGLGRNDGGPHGLAATARNVSAVTGACLLTSKQAWSELGGFDENAFPVDYNDVDFCLRLAQGGKRTVVAPNAVLLHHASQSRAIEFRPHELLSFVDRYRDFEDPFLNENVDPPFLHVNGSRFVHRHRMTSPKVLIVATDPPSDAAWLPMANRLMQLNRAGIALTLVTPSDWKLPSALETDGISHVPLRASDFAAPDGENKGEIIDGELGTVAAQLQKQHFDVMVCSYPRDSTVRLFAGLFGLPSIAYIDRLPPSAADSVGDSSTNVSQSALQGMRSVFATEALRRAHERQYGPCRDSGVLPPLADVDRIRAYCGKHDRASVRRKYGFREDHFVVTSLATLAPESGLHFLITAINQLAAARSPIPSLRFLIVGDGDGVYREFLRTLVSRDAERLVSFVSEPADTDEIFRLSDLFVSPSLSAILPIRVLEAMAFELPIISTDRWGISEIMRDASEGFLCPDKDPQGIASRIEWLHANPEIRQQTAAKARAHVTRGYNAAVQMAPHLDLLRQVAVHTH